jgi:hypothetical protein
MPTAGRAVDASSVVFAFETPVVAAGGRVRGAVSGLPPDMALMAYGIRFSEPRRNRPNTASMPVRARAVYAPRLKPKM